MAGMAWWAASATSLPRFEVNNGPVPTNRDLAPRSTIDVNAPSTSPSLVDSARLRECRELGHDMREQFLALAHDRLELLLECLAHRAPDERRPRDDLRRFLLQHRPRLLGQQGQTIVLEQNLAGTVLQHIDVPEAGDAQNALLVWRRREQIKLRIAAFGRAHFPSASRSAAERGCEALRDRLDLARTPGAVRLPHIRLEREHRHSFTSNSNRCSSGS